MVLIAPALVSSVTGECIRSTKGISAASRSPDGPRRGEPQGNHFQLFPWRVFGEFSEKDLSLITASWRPGTEKACNSAWKQWCGWCSKRKIAPFQDSIATVVEFITKNLKKGSNIPH